MYALNNLHQVRSKSKDWKPFIFFSSRFDNWFVHNKEQIGDVKYTMYRKPFLYQPHWSKFPAIIVFNIKYHKPWNAVIQWHVPDWHIPCIITVWTGEPILQVNRETDTLTYWKMIGVLQKKGDVCDVAMAIKCWRLLISSPEYSRSKLYVRFPYL
jgi:hypothetical protein